MSQRVVIGSVTLTSSLVIFPSANILVQMPLIWIGYGGNIMKTYGCPGWGIKHVAIDRLDKSATAPASVYTMSRLPCCHLFSQMFSGCFMAGCGDVACTVAHCADRGTVGKRLRGTTQFWDGTPAAGSQWPGQNVFKQHSSWRGFSFLPPDAVSALAWYLLWRRGCLCVTLMYCAPK